MNFFLILKKLKEVYLGDDTMADNIKEQVFSLDMDIS